MKKERKQGRKKASKNKAMADTGGAAPEAEEVVAELLTAGQALVVVFLVVAVTLGYGYRWWKREEAERQAESFLEYDFQLPEEKELFAKAVAEKPEDKPAAGGPPGGMPDMGGMGGMM